MHLSDEVHLSKIQKQCAYRDEKSLEETTGNIKRKYKLAGNAILDLDTYTFFVTTRWKDTCHKPLTLKVNPTDWVNPAENRFSDVTYIDIRKVTALTRGELLQKIKDSRNGFCYVAKLSDPKFTKLQSLLARMPYSRVAIAPETKRLIERALAKEADKVLRKLNLN